MKRQIYILLFLLLIVHNRAIASSNNDLENKLSRIPTDLLIEKGDSCLGKGYKDSAKLYYIIYINNNFDSKDKNETEECAKVFNKIGRIFQDEGNYSDALDYYIKGSKYCEAKKITHLLPGYYNNIATIYATYSDSTYSITYYRKSLELSEKFNNIECKILTLKNLSSLCYRFNNNELGDKYNKELLKMSKYDNSIRFFYYYNNGLLEANSNNIKAAIEYMKKAIEYAEKIKMQDIYIASTYCILAEYYRSINIDSTLILYNKSLDISEKNNIVYLAQRSANSLYSYYNEIGDSAKALEYKIRFWKITDPQLNNTEFNKIQNTRFYYELDSKSKELQQMNISMEMKEQQLHNARVRFITLLAASVLFVIFIFVLYRQKKKLHDTYKDLFGKNKELLKAEQESRRERSEFLSLLAHEREMNLLLLKQQTMNTTAKDEDSSEESPAEEEENTRLYSVDKISDDKKEIILRKINDVMENTKDFCDCGFTLDRLAKAVGSNARYVSHIIHETYNKSFPAYLNEYRIREAQIRLLDVENYGNYTIKAISESVGYKSLSGFISIFKSHTGMSPAIYQKMASEKQS